MGTRSCVARICSLCKAYVNGGVCRSKTASRQITSSSSMSTDQQWAYQAVETSQPPAASSAPGSAPAWGRHTPNHLSGQGQVPTRDVRQANPFPDGSAVPKSVSAGFQGIDRSWSRLTGSQSNNVTIVGCWKSWAKTPQPIPALWLGDVNHRVLISRRQNRSGGLTRWQKKQFHLNGGSFSGTVRLRRTIPRRQSLLRRPDSSAFRSALEAMDGLSSIRNVLDD